MLSRSMYTMERQLKTYVRRLVRNSEQSITAEASVLPECNAHALGDFVVRKLVPLLGTVPFPPNELMLMATAVSWLRPQLILEWGTNVGVSARVFHDTCQFLGIAADIHSIDLPDDVSHGEHPGRRRGILVRGLDVHLHQGDGARVAAELALEAGCRNPLVFIDGDHAFDVVVSDAVTIIAAAPDASLLFHDTFYQPGSTYNHGPAQAVDRIVALHPGRYHRIDAALGKPGMTLLTPLRSISQ